MLAGCRDKGPDMARVQDVFPNLPLPPAASMVSREGGPEALKLTLKSHVRPATVEAYYRETLSKNGWRLVSDSRDAEGALVLLAEQNGRPLWVRIQSADDSVAALVELAGAVTSRSKGIKPTS